MLYQIYLLYRCKIHTIILFTKYFLFNSQSGSCRAPPPGPPDGVCRHRRPRRRRRGSHRRSRRCREDRPSRTRVCRREERRSIATSSSQGASPGGKTATPHPLPPPRASARPPPPHGNRPTYHAPHANMVTMAPSPLVQNHVKKLRRRGKYIGKTISAYIWD